MQQQQTQAERQSLLLQKPVEIHQLSYQKQFDYEKSLAQNNCTATNEANSTSSEYNLLYRSEPKSAVYNNNGHGEMGNCSASNTLNRTTKKSNTNTSTNNNLGLNDSLYNNTNESNKMTQKQVDLAHNM